MERMPMCRVCLVENVRMYIVVDKDLHELYETLTDIPFVTEDRRPALACFLCIAKLKQCCQLQRKCLEAEELFAQMMNEPNPSVIRGQLEYSSGLTVTPVENISIVDVGHIESIAVKEELPAVCDRLDYVSKSEEENQSEELEWEHLNNSYLDVEDIPAQQSASNSEDDVPVTEIKTKEKEHVSRKKRRASDTTQAVVTKASKLHPRGHKLEDETEDEKGQKHNSGTAASQTTQYCTSELSPKTQETLSNTPRVNISVIDTTFDTDCRNLIKRINTGENPFRCDICQRCFNLKSDLTQHILNHIYGTPYKCPGCQDRFSWKSFLKNHIRTHHGEKPYKCEICQRCFSNRSSLNKHTRTHTGERPYKCKECPLDFRFKSSLASHIRSHRGEKPYKCEVCQLCFSQKYTLTQHIRKHTGEKPYKCEECQVCFSEKSRFNTHIRTHTGEKPFKCEECQRGFSCKNYLTRHIRTHTNISERPYQCKECQLYFNEKAHLILHIRTHTG